ncbi:alpha/beta hydrolase [Streptomyces purpurascens]|uniref:alpha/beta hydrolase n=1 Tax=Streptomyces purpurascens TaxID=1924 RepID=UPI0038650450
MHRALSLALAATAVAATVSPGVSVAATPDTVRWGPCPEDVAAPRLECSTMVTADQGGHGVHPFGRNTCANDAVTAFLTTGQRPSRDLACAAEPSR